jgi:hypothetical protein
MATRRDYLFIFDGACGYRPFQFVVHARTEEDARRRLWSTVQSADYHECKGNYAPDAREVFESSDIAYNSVVGKEAHKHTFQEFVNHSKVTQKNPTPVLFSSCLDG